MLILILFRLAHTFSVTLRIQEYAFSVNDVRHDRRIPNLEVGYKSHIVNTVVALVSCRAWKCVPRAISGGMKLLSLMSSQ